MFNNRKDACSMSPCICVSTQLDHGRTKEGPKKIELVASYQDGRESNMARENAMR